VRVEIFWELGFLLAALDRNNLVVALRKILTPLLALQGGRVNDVLGRAVFRFSETENFNPKFLQQSAPTSSICLGPTHEQATILSENSLTSSSSLCSTTLH